MNIRVGDRVRRKSGGPKGTVRKIPFESWEYGVAWDEGKANFFSAKRPAENIWGIDGLLIEHVAEPEYLFAADPALVRVGVHRKARFVAHIGGGEDLGEWWVAIVEPQEARIRCASNRFIAGGPTAHEAVQRAIGLAREMKLAGVKLGYYPHPQHP